MNYSENADGIGAEQASEHREGKVARAIEQQTAKLPSDLFLWAAGAAIVGSLALEIAGMRQQTRGIGRFFGGRMGASARQPLAGFVGMWAPTLLLLGIYNKIVKVAGSDRTSAGMASGLSSGMSSSGTSAGSSGRASY